MLIFVPRHVSFDLFENGRKRVTLNCIYAISFMSAYKELIIPEYLIAITGLADSK